MLYPVTPRLVSLVKLLKQRWKLLLLTFVLGVMLPKGLGTMLSANVVDWDNNPYSSLNSPEAILIEFHERANNLTNDYIESLLSEKSAAVVTPVIKKECRDVTKNVSSWCLSVELNEEMLEAQAQMMVVKNTWSDSVLDPNLSFFDQVRKSQYAQNQLVDDEMAIMEDSVDLTLAVYNQLVLVYPLHNELWELKDRLTVYQNELQKIRKIVEQYPGKFNDASTIHCK